MKNAVSPLLLWKVQHGNCLTHELEKPLSPEVKGKFEKLAKGRKSFLRTRQRGLKMPIGVFGDVGGS